MHYAKASSIIWLPPIHWPDVFIMYHVIEVHAPNLSLLMHFCFCVAQNACIYIANILNLRLPFGPAQTHTID